MIDFDKYHYRDWKLFSTWNIIGGGQYIEFINNNGELAALVLRNNKIMANGPFFNLNLHNFYIKLLNNKAFL